MVQNLLKVYATPAILKLFMQNDKLNLNDIFSSYAPSLKKIAVGLLLKHSKMC
jgi:hypothetical protein